MRGFFFISWGLILLGCASSTPQTEKLLERKSALPPVVQIENVPFIRQTTNYCGPATLAMAMNWAGQKVTLEDIAPWVYTPGMKGTLQSDLITASRRRGLMAVPLQGLEDLLLEVSAGNPVIVFENLSVSWLPQWHYAIVFGYDLPRQKILMHSGPEAFKQWDLRKFERSWKLGDYWGLVVLPPHKLSKTAGEMSHIKAALALEQIQRFEEADQAYQSILKRWPQSLVPLIGRANIAYTKSDFPSAVSFLKEARRHHPQEKAVIHNLAVAEEAARSQAKPNFNTSTGMK